MDTPSAGRLSGVRASRGRATCRPADCTGWAGRRRLGDLGSAGAHQVRDAAQEEADGLPLGSPTAVPGPLDSLAAPGVRALDLFEGGVVESNPYDPAIGWIVARGRCSAPPPARPRRGWPSRTRCPGPRRAGRRSAPRAGRCEWPPERHGRTSAAWRPPPLPKPELRRSRSLSAEPAAPVIARLRGLVARRIGGMEELNQELAGFERLVRYPALRRLACLIAPLPTIARIYHKHRTNRCLRQGPYRDREPDLCHRSTPASVGPDHARRGCGHDHRRCDDRERRCSVYCARPRAGRHAQPAAEEEAIAASQSAARRAASGRAVANAGGPASGDQAPPRGRRARAGGQSPV